MSRNSGYPCDFLEQLQANGERILEDVLSSGGSRDEITWPLSRPSSWTTSGVTRCEELSFPRGSVLRLWANVSGQDEDVAQFDVSPSEHAYSVHQITIPSDRLLPLAQLIRFCTSCLVVGCREGSEPFRLGLPGGWCLHLVPGLPGRTGPRALLSVGPADKEHVSFWIVIPESALEDLAERCERLAVIREGKKRALQ